MYDQIANRQAENNMENKHTSKSNTMAAGRQDFSGRLKREFMFPPIIPIPAAFCRILLSEK